MEVPITMNFMNLISNKEKRSNGRVEIRASNLPVWQSPPFDYPTLQTEGYIGKGIRLETKSTGDFGEKVKMPIAAGNLFIGTFIVKMH